MERNPWKLATIGMALVGTTALGTGVTTAWMLRPLPEPQMASAPAAVTPRPAVAYAATPVPAAMPAPRPAPRPAPAVARAETPTRVTPVASTTAPDCATGGERAMRIAKPGAIGALLGAGLGAGGGAIASGGKGAGKGALIGGLAGAALGAGYGAYKTKNECGTIFGGTTGSGFAAAPASRPDTVQALAPSAESNRIQVYGIQR
jgi:hypothetical protein